MNEDQPQIGDVVIVKDHKMGELEGVIDDYYILKGGARLYIVLWYDTEDDVIDVALVPQEMLELVRRVGA